MNGESTNTLRGMAPTLESIDIPQTAKEVCETTINPVLLAKMETTLAAFVALAKERANKYKDNGWGVVVNQSSFDLTTTPFVQPHETLLAWSPAIGSD
jgi:hypothetical protein